MSRKRKSDLQTGLDQEMVTTKALYKPSEDRMNKYVYTTDKNHSKLLAAKEFGFFIISLLNAYLEIRYSRNNYIFYMDNARTHKAKAIQDLLSQIITCYSAPYSPFLNPIEEVFGTWKHFYRKLIHASNDTVPTCICKSAQVITSHKLQKYWENSLKYVLKSLRKEEID